MAAVGSGPPPPTFSRAWYYEKCQSIVVEPSLNPANGLSIQYFLWAMQRFLDSLSAIGAHWYYSNLEFQATGIRLSNLLHFLKCRPIPGKIRRKKKRAPEAGAGDEGRQKRTRSGRYAGDKERGEEADDGELQPLAAELEEDPAQDGVQGEDAQVELQPFEARVEEQPPQEGTQRQDAEAEEGSRQDGSPVEQKARKTRRKTGKKKTRAKVSKNADILDPIGPVSPPDL